MRHATVPVLVRERKKQSFVARGIFRLHEFVTDPPFSRQVSVLDVCVSSLSVCAITAIENSIIQRAVQGPMAKRLHDEKRDRQNRRRVGEWMREWRRGKEERTIMSRRYGEAGTASGGVIDLGCHGVGESLSPSANLVIVGNI